MAAQTHGTTLFTTDWAIRNFEMTTARRSRRTSNCWTALQNRLFLESDLSPDSEFIVNLVVDEVNQQLQSAVEITVEITSFQGIVAKQSTVLQSLQAGQRISFKFGESAGTMCNFISSDGSLNLRFSIVDLRPLSIALDYDPSAKPATGKTNQAAIAPMARLLFEDWPIPGSAKSMADEYS
jgi:hypothetical protein